MEMQGCPFPVKLCLCKYYNSSIEAILNGILVAVCIPRSSEVERKGELIQPGFHILRNR